MFHITLSMKDVPFKKKPGYGHHNIDFLLTQKNNHTPSHSTPLVKAQPPVMFNKYVNKQTIIKPVK